MIRVEPSPRDPAPTDDELAAIVAAIEVLWPQPDNDGVGGTAVRAASSRWRFSGRWWSEPVARRRQRP